MIRYLLSRMGCLMFLIGAIVLILGVAAESSGQPAFNMVLIGAGLALLGLLLWNKLRRRPRSNTRFSMFRGRGQEDAQDAEDEWDDRHYDR